MLSGEADNTKASRTPFLSLLSSGPRVRLHPRGAAKCHEFSFPPFWMDGYRVRLLSLSLSLSLRGTFSPQQPSLFSPFDSDPQHKGANVCAFQCRGIRAGNQRFSKGETRRRRVAAHRPRSQVCARVCVRVCRRLNHFPANTVRIEETRYEAREDAFRAFGLCLRTMRSGPADYLLHTAC